MRPLIEILEDERSILQRLESISIYILKDSDPEVQEILLAQRGKFKKELVDIQLELGERIEQLLD